jgi:hypothetical protein
MGCCRFVLQLAPGGRKVTLEDAISLALMDVLAATRLEPPDEPECERRHRLEKLSTLEGLLGRLETTPLPERATSRQVPEWLGIQFQSLSGSLH